MNRIDRLTAILIHLQTKRVVRAQELADRFGISLRTVYRDVRALEEAGVPIGAEAGIGYFLESYHLPPVHLTRAEASALLFGGKLIRQWTDESVRTEFESALFKIKSVLKRPDQEHLEDLEPHVDVHKPKTMPGFSAVMLNDLQQAVARNQVMEIEYYSAYSEKTTERLIEPVGLYHYGSGWHLIAFCQTRQDYRDFRIDRIRQFRLTGQFFSRQHRLTLQDYLNRERQMPDRVDVSVLFDKKITRYIQEQRFAYGYVSEDDLGDTMRLHFRTSYPEALCRWLLMFGNSARVEQPKHLTAFMRTLAEEIREHYLKSE